MRNRITFSLLETIEVPTLLITGGADLYAPPPVLALFAARIRGAESMIVPEVGPLRVLGAARDLQPGRAGVPPEAEPPRCRA